MIHIDSNTASAPRSQETVAIAASGYTPGPWIARGKVTTVGDENNSSMLWCGTVAPAGSKFRGSIANIQSCDHIGGISREEAAANARLIAAAPDLLSAAKGLLALLDDGTCTADPEESEISFARAAIAKAQAA